MDNSLNHQPFNSIISAACHIQSAAGAGGSNHSVYAIIESDYVVLVHLSERRVAGNERDSSALQEPAPPRGLDV